ncbi:hypothetical protein HJC02_23935 [Rhizobium sp. NLR4a]|uniref:hypothetical protein n=1 Tax=Rhizobium sp. NLR4a TaxID=2731117 RepID=UPI001C82F51D|nr:hypothetical protein [Rhizobium sp. NLR4a]MBX5235289.1 hypothetical protein [Rhizobium sp. NLR4a]
MANFIESCFDRRLGYGMLINDRYGILGRTANLIQISSEAPEELKRAFVRAKNSRSQMKAVMTEALSTPTDPLPSWTLFRGLLEGAHRFVSRELKSWDNEGVLTGSLLTRLFDGVQVWGSQVVTATGRDPELHVCRANTVLNYGEGISGGDFGLIIQRGNDNFVSFVIQVKLVSYVSADVSHYVGATDQFQRDTLSRTPGLGHYLFIRKRSRFGGGFAPVMISAQDVVTHVQATEGRSYPAMKAGVDMAAYLSFGPSTGADIGVRTTTPDDAVQIILEGYPDLVEALDRIYVIRAGSEFDYDWNRIISNYSEYVAGVGSTYGG